jgi:hypothetical protein
MMDDLTFQADIILHTDAPKFGGAGVLDRMFSPQELKATKKMVPSEIHDLIQQYALEDVPINVKELFAVVTAACTWGKNWRSLNVRFFCDNLGDVQAVQKSRSKNTQIMHLLRVLNFVAALFDFQYELVHIEGVKNVVADAASRVHVKRFLHEHGAYQQVQPVLPPHFDSSTWEMDVSQQLMAELKKRDSEDMEH